MINIRLLTSWLQAAGYRLQVTGCRLQAAGCRLQAAGSLGVGSEG